MGSTYENDRHMLDLHYNDEIKISEDKTYSVNFKNENIIDENYDSRVEKIKIKFFRKESYNLINYN